MSNNTIELPRLYYRIQRPRTPPPLSQINIPSSPPPAYNNNLHQHQQQPSFPPPSYSNSERNKLC